MVEADCSFQVSRDGVIRCYQFVSLSAFAIYFVIWYMEPSELLFVFLDAECDRANRENPRTWCPHSRPAVADFDALLLFFSRSYQNLFSNADT